MRIEGTPTSLDIKKPEIESVEQEKQEFKLIGKYLRKPGLKLFQYDHLKDEVIEVEAEKKTSGFLTWNESGHITMSECAEEEAVVDSRFEHFESLNITNATKRVKKFKQGKIKELCNLREPNPNGIKIY